MNFSRKVRGFLVIVTVAVVALTFAVTASARPGAGQAGGRPTIRYTEGGVPHIIASDYQGLGEGYGYAVSKDNFCTLADIYLSIRAERSKYLGPDGSANVGFKKTTNNLDSDFYFQRLKDDRTVEKLLNRPAPSGPDPEVRALARGVVKGFNRYLSETGVESIKDPACRGASWVRPLTEIDAFRYAYHAVMMGSTDYLLEGQVNAKPTVGVSPNSPSARPPKDAARRITAAMNANRESGIGSNALAVGSDGMAAGRGMMLTNPHLSWYGKNRMYQSHLTIPGKLNAAGSAIVGLPGVMFGHNNDVAWAHTVATVAPFGLFDVQVDPLHPTKYLVDGKWQNMTSQQVTVGVRKKGGAVEKVSRTLWRTRYGPVTTSLKADTAVPLPWVVSAHVVRDANSDNLRALNTWTRMARAKNNKEIADVLEETQGVPFLNTLSADRTGQAQYTDIQAAPNITDEHAKKCLTASGKLLFYGKLVSQPLSILDGKRSACDWPNDPKAAAPGLLSPQSQPRLIRRDFVGNANDSPWLANPEQPLSYPRVMGDTGTARSPRTQQLIRTAQKRIDGSDGLPGKKFTPKSMRELLFADRSRVAEQVRTDTVKMCEGFVGGRAPHSGGLIDVRQACPVLEKWDGSYTLNSRGSLLFQKFWDGAGDAWQDSFDPKDPVNTPRKLAINNPKVRLAFGNAVAELRQHRIALDAPLGEHQTVSRNGARIPIHGSRSKLGVLNVVEPVWDEKKGGNGDVTWGSSYVVVTAFNGDGPPETATLMTYSQSADPTSPHYADQTRLFSRRQWVTERFTEQQIAGAPGLKVKVLD